MKTLNEYKKECEQAEKNYKILKDKTQAADEAIREKWSGLPIAARIKNPEYQKDCDTSIAALQDENRAGAIAIICRENLRHAKAEELRGKIPVIINKYAGKRAGEKTCDKIREEFRPLGYYLIMRREYNNAVRYLEFSPLEDGIIYYHAESIEIGRTDYKDVIIDGATNILQTITEDDLRVYGVFDYIDDPAAYVQEADELRIRYEQKRKEFEEIEKEYKRKIAIFERR